MKTAPDFNVNPQKDPEDLSDLVGIKLLHFTIVNITLIGLVLLVSLIYSNYQPPQQNTIHHFIESRNHLLDRYLSSITTDSGQQLSAQERLVQLDILVKSLEKKDLPDNYQLANREFINTLRDWNNIRDHIFKLRQNEDPSKSKIIQQLINDLKKTDQKLETTLEILTKIEKNFSEGASTGTIVPLLKNALLLSEKMNINSQSKTNAKGIDDRDKKAGDEWTFILKEIVFTFRWCPQGNFLMGSPPTEKKENPNSETVRKVVIDQGFWMLETEVTQNMWQSIMKNNPSGFKGMDLPVEQISWIDCQKFIEKMNEIKNSALPGKIDLPTETEWEYACRAGTQTPFSFGEVLNGNQANCDGNFPYGTTEKGPLLNKTAPVKSYKPNAWGLYDMHGNVWEWCSSPFRGNSNQDIKIPNSRLMRIVRGGGWLDNGEYCRSAYSRHNPPDAIYDGLGFRLVIRPKTDP